MPDVGFGTSLQQAFNPSAGDYVIEAFGRLQVHPPALTSNHWYQARLSANFLQVDIANIGMPLLWKQTLLQIPLLPGLSLYTLPMNAVAVLDGYIRTYQTGNVQNFPANFTTTLGSLTVNINQPLHSYANGTMVWYPIPISVGGIIIQGPQFVSAVIDQNNYQIEVQQYPGTATGGSFILGSSVLGGPDVLGGGMSSFAVVPAIGPLADSLFLVQFPAHSMSGGQIFYINVPTTVGGVLLSGGFTVVEVLDQNNFVIQGPQQGSPLSGSFILGLSILGGPMVLGGGTASLTPMNGGLAQAQTQAYNQDPIDFILYPISRSEYAAQPDKGPNLEFRPTTFWFIRTRQPQIQFWVPPDNAGPYVFNLWIIQQQDDFVVSGSVGVDIPWRFGEAFAAGLAHKLFFKFPPPVQSGVSYAMIKDDYDGNPQPGMPVGGALGRALREDIDRVPLIIAPGLEAYYR